MGECAPSRAKALSEGEKSFENATKERDFSIRSSKISHGEDLLPESSFKLSFSELACLFSAQISLGMGVYLGCV
jgi:hypothetical protein